MKRTLAILALLALIFPLSAIGIETEQFFRFRISQRAELSRLTRIISISHTDGNTIYAYANDSEWQEFLKLGYKYEILPHPGTLLESVMAPGLKDLEDWDTYPTYEQYDSIMTQFAVDYPALCVLDTLGSTVQGRKLLAVRVSDNVGSEEDEPGVFYTSTMHGDETTGYVLLLRLIDYLLSNYGANAQVTRLVDSLEIWINPNANPDGTYRSGNHTVSGATRYNANNIDLNRNFPDPDDGPNPTGAWQPETVAMMNFADAHSIVLSANFHGGAEVVNYPWDTWVRSHVDEAWYVDLSRLYADSAQFYGPVSYMNDLDDGITNGYAWYEVIGGRQDYMNYYQGCREVTIELSQIKLVSGFSLPGYWNYNRVSLLSYLEEALHGIRGIVTDSLTGLPLYAVINVVNHDSELDSSQVYTDPDVGDYHRMVASGTYELQFISPGYVTKNISGISVSNGTDVVVDVALRPSDYIQCGDVDGSGEIDISDMLYLTDYMFSVPPGPAPVDMNAANVDGLGGLDIADLLYFVDYMFSEGPDLNCPS